MVVLMWCSKWLERKIHSSWLGNVPVPMPSLRLWLSTMSRKFYRSRHVWQNLTFKTGGVDGCDCAEILQLIAEGKIDTTPLITHRFPFSQIEEAYRIFEQKLDGVIKVAITPDE